MDLVTFTEEILDGKLYFLYSDRYDKGSKFHALAANKLVIRCDCYGTC